MDVLLKGISDRSLVEQIKHILDMVRALPFSYLIVWNHGCKPCSSTSADSLIGSFCFIFKANRASLRREVLHTDFLTPPILNEAMAALKKLADVNAIPNGGYLEVNFFLEANVSLIVVF